jgi:hypothetical protein
LVANETVAFIPFSKFTISTSDPDVRKFLADYGVGIGRSFWGPFSYSYGKTKKVGEYPFSEKPLNYTDLKETKKLDMHGENI